MKRTEVAYLAGFFDGEGSITMSLQQGKYLRLEVAVSQNTADVLWMFVRGFRGNIYEGSRCLQWKVHGQQAVQFLRTIIPYLVVKRLDAEETAIAWERRDDVSFVIETINKKRARHESLKQHYDRRTIERTEE